VGKHYDLGASARNFHNLMDGLTSAKSILAVEWIIKNNKFLRLFRVALQVGQKK
jgi:hypothetical protein